MPAISSTADAPIAALATAPGLGGVALIRLSGEGVYPLVDRLTPLAVPPSQRPAGTFVHTRLLGAAGEVLDDAVLLFFRAPHSYTGEDTIELCIHGGRMVAERVLERLWQLGARPAAPGEFTKRAFLNGRLDLTQAEAVADLIAARSPRAERAARANLQGRLGHALDALYDSAITLAADLEHALDFEEGELPEDFFPARATRLTQLSESTAALLATWHAGRLTREGALVALAGKPNAGKSTLLNLLLGYRRAIVSNEPGTTRDSIEETFLLDGLPIRLVDTAGLREAPSAIEREGVQRARELVAQADVVLYLSAADESADEPPPGAILLKTKVDLAPANAVWPAGVAAISATTAPEVARQTVCDCLREALHTAAEEPPNAQLANARQYASLAEAAEALRQAQAALERGEWGLVPAAQALRTAAEALGTILGKVYSEDLLDRVFANFCVGK